MGIDFTQWITMIKGQIQEISVAELATPTNTAPVIVDVREPDEYARGCIPDAILIPRGQLEQTIGQHVGDPQTRIVLYCAVGERSALAAQSLESLGYDHVSSLAEGFEGWQRAGHPWDVPQVLPAAQRVRYSRHLLLSEIGDNGQQRLLESKVLLIGAGGLGSPAAFYLAAAGVGTLGIIDYDVVDATNLQRQILHNTDRLGRRKVDSARQTLSALNPDVSISTVAERVSADNVLELFEGFDVVVDGADNFPTRYLVNDASLNTGTPVVHGSVFRFEGQASVFDPYRGPCYRCLFPAPPPPELAPSCSEAGVLGAVPGVVGSVQAVETIKVLLDIGEPLVGKLLIYDALDQDFRVLTVRRNPACPACRDKANPPRLTDYGPSCLPAGNEARRKSSNPDP